MPSLSRQTIMLLALVVLVAVVIFAGPAACQKIRSQGAQTRLGAEQANAAGNSAADAVDTTQNVSSNAVGSEELTRSNEREIRNAEGANDRVGAGVNAAGRRALCLRDAYRHRPECRMFQPTPN
jgi:hypothetical protein